MRFCNWKYEVLGEDPLDLFNSLFGDSIITSGSNSSGTRDLTDDEEGEGEDGDEETHEESPSPSTNSENSRFTCGKIDSKFCFSWKILDFDLKFDSKF